MEFLLWNFPISNRENKLFNWFHRVHTHSIVFKTFSRTPTMTTSRKRSNSLNQCRMSNHRIKREVNKRKKIIRHSYQTLNNVNSMRQRSRSCLIWVSGLALTQIETCLYTLIFMKKNSASITIIINNKLYFLKGGNKKKNQPQWIQQSEPT